jgi:Spy/CpxP family protein refolding chaperone
MRISKGKFTHITIAIVLLGLMALGAAEASAAQGRRFKQPGPAQQQRREQKREERLRDRAEAKPNQQMGNIFGGGIQARLWARLLKLSDDQIRRMQQLRRQSLSGYVDLESQIRQKRQGLERAIYSETYNEEEVKQLATELARLEGQRVLMRTRIQSQMRQMLTPEQVRTFNDLRFGSMGNFPLDSKPDATTEENKD